MKSVSKTIFFIFTILLYTINSQSIRPVKDSIGFCWNPVEMNRFIEWLDKKGEENKFESKNLIAAISVHDDYLYAGKVYYPLYKLIKAKEVVIFGVTHGSVRKELGILKDLVILDEFDEWCGPFSNIKISPLRELIKRELGKENYIISNKAHSIEHSIEAVIPFLQYYNKEVKITPIMITPMSPEKTENISEELSQIISRYIRINHLELGKDVFFLISNDANHYGEDFKNSPFGLDLKAHELATKNDKRIISENLTGEITKAKIRNLETEILPDTTIQKQIPLWCGRFPITLGLRTISKITQAETKNGLTGLLYKYSDSLTEKVLPFQNTSMGLTAIFSPKHWCGWFTLGIYQQ